MLGEGLEKAFAVVAFASDLDLGGGKPVCIAFGDAFDLELGSDGREGGFEFFGRAVDFDLVGGVVDEGVA